MRLEGLIEIAFDDTGSVERDAYATIAVSIDVQTEEIETADPDEYGPRTFKPGVRRWTGQATYNEVILTNLTRKEAQTELEALHLARTRFPVTFTSLAGTAYASTAWIPSLNISSGDQQVLRASVSFRGVAELVATVPDPVTPEPEVPTVTDIFYITDPSTGTNGDLRKLTI